MPRRSSRRQERALLTRTSTCRMPQPRNFNGNCAGGGVLLVAADQVAVGILVVLGQHDAGLPRSVCDCPPADSATDQREMGHRDRMAGGVGVAHRVPSCQPTRSSPTNAQLRPAAAGMRTASRASAAGGGRPAVGSPGVDGGGGSGRRAEEHRGGTDPLDADLGGGSVSRRRCRRSGARRYGVTGSSGGGCGPGPRSRNFVGCRAGLPCSAYPTCVGGPGAW